MTDSLPELGFAVLGVFLLAVIAAAFVNSTREATDKQVSGLALFGTFLGVFVAGCAVSVGAVVLL